MMYQDAVVVVAIVGVAAHVRSTVDDEDALVATRGQTLGENAACEPRPDNKPIKHGR